ncbi:hypothetical protein BIV57_04420 [Mangrovactinospora gilvigrisea]|uniref:HTH marR-type domain-containing protein n=2 Tax=Mangrovactinospora gilvigrisea TaxID=1428644 RepID=A0A1J7BJ46_9ACTN|nr:hypothetical protein BIV57_04420 [Mangrovactinospora gilvigrisea]
MMVVQRLLGGLRTVVHDPHLSFASAGVLSTLNRRGACRVTELAEAEGITQPAATQMVAKLQRAGLVTVTASDEDRRVRMVATTDAGRQRLAERQALRAERLAALLDRLSPSDRHDLAAALPALERLAEEALAEARRG